MNNWISISNDYFFLETDKYVFGVEREDKQVWKILIDKIITAKHSNNKKEISSYTIKTEHVIGDNIEYIKQLVENEYINNDLL